MTSCAAEERCQLPTKDEFNVGNISKNHAKNKKNVETSESLTNIVPFPFPFPFPYPSPASCDGFPIYWTTAQVARHIKRHRQVADAMRRAKEETPADMLGMARANDYLAREVTKHLGGDWHGDYGLAPGPGHSPKDRSLQISAHDSNPDDVVLFSHCGDDWKAIKDNLRACGILQAKPKPNGKDGDHKTFICAYDYVNEDGKLVFQVCRYLKADGDKTFLQRRPDGNGSWIWKKGERVVPYRLPDVVKAIAAKRLVFVCEGEKDCDALAKLGLTASCNAGGASEDGKRPKWTAKHAAFFRGADVVVLPDNDDAGRAHGEAVAISLQGIAARVRKLELPGLKEKGDVSDWLAIGGDLPRLMALAESAPDWQPKPGDDAARFEDFDIDDIKGRRRGPLRRLRYR